MSSRPSHPWSAPAVVPHVRERELSGRGQRIVAAGIAVAAAAGIAAITAMGAADARQGLWAGVAALLAIVLGLVARSRAAVLAGSLGLIVQYAIAMIGREGLDVGVAVQTGLMGAMIEAAHWSLEGSNGTVANAAALARRLLRIGVVATAGWLLGLGVLLASLGAANPVIARSVAVALFVVVWVTVIDLLRSAGTW